MSIYYIVYDRGVSTWLEITFNPKFDTNIFPLWTVCVHVDVVVNELNSFNTDCGYSFFAYMNIIKILFVVSLMFFAVVLYYHFKGTNNNITRRKKNTWIHLWKNTEHRTRDLFYICIHRTGVHIYMDICNTFYIQKSNCWTDRIICLNKADANVGEWVRAYIHVYVQMITM